MKNHPFHQYNLWIHVVVVVVVVVVICNTLQHLSFLASWLLSARNCTCVLAAEFVLRYAWVGISTSNFEALDTPIAALDCVYSPHNLPRRWRACGKLSGSFATCWTSRHLIQKNKTIWRKYGAIEGWEQQIITRWWFPIFLPFTPIWGKWLIQFDVRIFFKWVGEKPPTRITSSSTRCLFSVKPPHPHLAD